MEENVVLTDTDIKAVVEIIDIVSSRGAFKGEELQFIGAVRNKFDKFYNQVIEQSKEPQEEPQEEVESQEE